MQRNINSPDILINQFSNVRVLVIGDIMLDVFAYGNVERISPEAPVPVFKFHHKSEMLGGAGNVVANLAALGCKTTYIGIIGKDDNGKKIASLLKNVNANNHLLKLADYPTIVKTRFIANTNHLLRMDNEEVLPVITTLLPRIRKILFRAISSADIILLSDYNKGLLTAETTPMVIEICRELKKTVIVDPKGNNYAKYSGATLVKPNLKEFSEITKKKYDPNSKNFLKEVKEAAKYLCKLYEIKNFIITLSEHGMILVEGENTDRIQQISSTVREVCDVSGAGDTALATLGATLGCGASMSEAMKLANQAAGIVVGKLGTATVSASELKTSLISKQSKYTLPQDKIITLKQANSIVQLQKSKGKIIGFTNGCFDCCHLGHLHSLIEAKKYCDVLFVAINSDKSVKQLKGNSRPIQDEKTRSMLIASLEYVDYVLVFNEITPLAIIDALHPDIIAKEGYSLENWPEAQFAIQYGARVITLNRLDGYSTSNLINRIQN